MLYALVYYTALDNPEIAEFRKKYDPWCSHVKDHITLVFPVPATIGLDRMKEHVSTVLKNWSPFNIRINKLEKSWDHFLFLTLDEGRGKVIRLHNDLYRGILEPYRREDIQYVPHIGLGMFAKGDYDPLNPKKLPLNEELYSQALLEAYRLDVNCTRIVDKLFLVGVEDDLSACKDLCEMPLA